MMTERYKAIPETVSYKDTVTGEVLCPKYEKDYYTLLDVLNDYDKTFKMFKTKEIALNRQNEQLTEEIKALQDLNNQELQEYEDKIKRTIRAYLETERTEIGKNVLKQLYEAIQ